jgi:hypothetical protein
MLKVLRLLDVNAEIDPVRLECSRRLACTIALLDRFVALPLKLAPHLSDAVPMMMTDDEFWALKRRAPGAPPRKASVNQEILRLSETLVQTCTASAAGDTATLVDVRRSLEGYWADDPGLQYTQANLDLHRDKDTLRSFVYMHVLYHHVGQLAHFSSAPGAIAGPSPECHHHARSIAAITQHTWLHAGLDLHNVTVGQIFTLASVVLSHALLITPSPDDEQLRLVLRASITRVKNHTRMFNWVVSHHHTSMGRFWVLADIFSCNISTNGRPRRGRLLCLTRKTYWMISSSWEANSRSWTTGRLVSWLSRRQGLG